MCNQSLNVLNFMAYRETGSPSTPIAYVHNKVLDHKGSLEKKSTSILIVGPFRTYHR